MWRIIDVYLGILIMTIGVLYFDKLVLNEKIAIPKKRLLKVIFMLSIVHIIIYFNLTGIIKTIIMCIINTALCRYSFKVTLHKAILTTFVYMVILIIPDAMELIVFTKIFGMSKEHYYNDFAGTALCSLIVCLSFLLITILLKQKISNIINTKIEDNRFIIIYVILTFLCIALFFYNSFTNIVINMELIASIFIIIVFISILFSLIKQTTNNNKLTNEYDTLLEYMTTYENEIENQRIIRHEAKNELRTIRAMICDNINNDKIIGYIDEIVNDKYEVKKEKYAKFGYFPPNGIKGLCYFKTQEAENNGIKVGINISKRVKESTIYNLNIKQQRDFGLILGVFLDNAIEASIESNQKQLGIEAYVNEQNEFKLILSNTYNNLIDKKRIGRENFSTKGKNRGYGLLLVNKLVEKNDIFEIKNEILSNIYIQTIIIKNNQ